MKILLDTHLFLWAISEPGRLSADARRKVESRANVVYISAISIAEIAIKASIGKLAVDFNPCEQVVRAGFELLDFTGGDALRLQSLPFHHRDPFDRMLISQSLETGIPILTHDAVFRSYNCRIA